MNLGTTRALRGPNIWSQLTVLEVEIDNAMHLDKTTQEIDAIRNRAVTMLPELNRPASPDDENETIGRTSSMLLAELVARAMIALQQHAGCAVKFARVSEFKPAGVCKIAVQYCEEPVGRMALAAAAELVKAAIDGQNFDSTARVATIRSLDQQIRLGPSTGSIVRAALARGIPARRLNDRSLVQLGYGCKQHRILAAETDRTSAVAESIVQDKELTKQLLDAVGVPVPKGRPVTSAEDAWAAAQQIGVPVVIKPQDGNQGRGVACNLNTREQVLAAYAAAIEEGDEIICEKFAHGADYRLLVIGYKLVAAARREPPQVTGDGRHTINQLVEEANKDPRRGEDHATSLSKLRLDEIAKGVLQEQGLTVDSIPAAGQIVLIRRNANLSTGGSATDVTDLVHPEVAARVIDGVQMVGLDIAGVDVVCQDISRPLEQQGGIIVEINAAPGLRMHLEPSAGKPRAVGEAIVGTMFKPEDDGRIPIVALSGTNGKTTTTRLISHILRCTGKRVGMTCTDGVYLNDRRLDTGDCSGPKSARTVLANPAVEAAVLETARGGILREGLGFDLCNTAVVTNIADGDHLGLNGIETPEQLARVKRVIVESVSPSGYAVLNADDPLTASMAEYCPGKTLFFSKSPTNPLLVSHRAKGGKVVYVRNNCIMAAEGSWEARIALLDSVPLTFGGLIGFQVENAMAAASAAWTLGVPFEMIRHALETFVNDTQKVPARFNVLQFQGSTIVIDYGHNAAAITALCEAFNKMPHERRVIVYTAAGDRRDEDIIRQAELIANGFDFMVLYEDACTRGREDGEVCRLMRKGFALGKRLRPENVVETRGEMKAIEMTLRQMVPGDLVLIQADQVEEAIAFVQQLLPKLASEQLSVSRK
ncbi:cyanophycin synthetase [Schlesneria paludicola]|uniref:cyanophycin synthetase n=1 Tax=Schlesneria paludicola TaxID=360056 RepID=UPI00029AB84D|nr:cyanophycin synthetase [Schlesneria paludicola]